MEALFREVETELGARIDRPMERLDKICMQSDGGNCSVSAGGLNTNHIDLIIDIMSRHKFIPSGVTLISKGHKVAFIRRVYADWKAGKPDPKPKKQRKPQSKYSSSYFEKEYESASSSRARSKPRPRVPREPPAPVVERALTSRDCTKMFDEILDLMTTGDGDMPELDAEIQHFIDWCPQARPALIKQITKLNQLAVTYRSKIDEYERLDQDTDALLAKLSLISGLHNRLNTLLKA